ncbi:DUF3105 domain-containing protein [Ornatilinea apprima]|uniref:DUF3105 domain-containing protein n=1 Tax=Ornatilinea apprima TaxID=1134406 RepID=UPI00094682E4|nr:DUF3105 domain-containing protein [Ornatilinea apprima]
MTSKQVNRSAKERARTQKTRIPWGLAGGGVVTVLLVSFLVFQALQSTPMLGEAYPIASREHIPDGQKAVDYNSDPPTSGQHYDQPAEAGFYEVAPPDEALVHNLEHGHVVVYYNCELVDEAACASLKEQIKQSMSRAGVARETGTIKLVAAPRPGMPNLITYTSWGRLYRAEGFDANEFQLYVKQNRNRLTPEPHAE